LEINNILPQALQAEVRINTSFEGNTEKGISQTITLQPEFNHIIYSFRSAVAGTLDAEWLGKSPPCMISPLK
jgi:hypothetical protein